MDAVILRVLEETICGVYFKRSVDFCYRNKYAIEKKKFFYSFF